MRRLPPHHLGHDEAGALAEMMRCGTLSVEALVQHHCALVYAQTGSHLETANAV